MAAAALKEAIVRDLPVLFVNIGWTVHYDGTEVVVGNHAYLQDHPGETVGESSAFARTNKSLFRCGIGRGAVPFEELHIVFVARDPGDSILKAVGIYAAATVSLEDQNWGVAETRVAERIPIGQRPQIRGWPAGQGMRRWAKRNGTPGKEYKALLALFRALAKGLSSSAGLSSTAIGTAEDEDGFEGEERKLWVRHRKRERKFRAKKLADAMKKNGNRLICEVPKCGFDFFERYGELGAGFAEVHHKKPLSEAPRKGQAIRLSDLAVVCANCHRMIHRNGQCRPLNGLIRPLKAATDGPASALEGSAVGARKAFDPRPSAGSSKDGISSL